MHVAHFETPVVFVAKDMRPESYAGSEVYAGNSCRHVVRREKGAATQFKIRDKSLTGSEIPLEIQGIYSDSVSSIGGLEYQEHRNPIYRVLKSPL